MDLIDAELIGRGSSGPGIPNYLDYPWRRRGLHATALLNSAVATRYPALAAEIAASAWEVAAAGVDMGRLHHGGLAESGRS